MVPKEPALPRLGPRDHGRTPLFFWMPGGVACFQTAREDTFPYFRHLAAYLSDSEMFLVVLLFLEGLVFSKSSTVEWRTQHCH